MLKKGPKSSKMSEKMPLFYPQKSKTFTESPFFSPFLPSIKRRDLGSRKGAKAQREVFFTENRKQETENPAFPPAFLLFCLYFPMLIWYFRSVIRPPPRLEEDTWKT